MDIDPRWLNGYEAAKADIINLIANLESERGSVLESAKEILKYQIRKLDPNNVES